MPISAEKKEDLIAKIYFGVTDNPKDDVNPYRKLDEFLAASVGSLRWGESDEVRYRSKYSFSDIFVQILDLFHVSLSFDQAMEGVKDDTKKNSEVVKTWASQAKFPNL